MFDVKEFIKDRNEAFASMDKDKILAYCEKYSIPVPEDELTFWAGVHKSVCNLYLLGNSMISLEQYNESYDWLKSHSCSPLITDIGGEE